jgi:site-specific DNA-methyltransferase (adenine-specific)
MIDLKHGDCLELMKDIPDKSIDMILCDLPYGTTALNWDKQLDFDKLWEQYERIIKDNGIICLFGIQPFTSLLISSKVNLYRYSWIWKKDTATGHLNANYKCLNITEDICIFSKASVGSLSKNPIRYYPIGLRKINKTKKNNPNSTWRQNKGYNSMNNILTSDKTFVQKYTGYPNNILEFARDKEKYHPTQKPVTLLEYLIKTYTNVNEIVLDNCMGSGSTGVACKQLNRKFIGIELDETYFNIAKERIENTKIQESLILNEGDK